MTNRAQRRASQHKRGTIRNLYHIDPMAGLRLLDHARPYEPGEMVSEHVLTRAAFERLRTGCGNEDDFDRVSMMLNIGQVRAEAIDALLVETITRGQMAFVRCKDRYLRGLAFGFDAQGLQDVPDALQAYEAIVDASSPQQLKRAMREVARRISGGDFVVLDMVPDNADEMKHFEQQVSRIGKKAAGRLLDGREWNGAPS